MKAIDLFNRFSGVNTLYLTEDGVYFKNESDAKTQASALKKQGKGTGKVTPVTRAEAVADDAKTQEAAKAAGEVAGQGNATPELNATQKGQLTKANNKIATAKAALDAAVANNASAEEIAPLQAALDAANAALVTLQESFTTTVTA